MATFQLVAYDGGAMMTPIDAMRETLQWLKVGKYQGTYAVYAVVDGCSVSSVVCRGSYDECETHRLKLV